MSWEQYTDLANIIFNTAASNLALMLNQEVALQEPVAQEFDSLSSAIGTDAEPFGADKPKVAIFTKLSGDGETDQIYILTNQQAKYLANTMLGNTDAEASDDPLDELQSSAVGEIFSQILNSTISQIGTAVSQEMSVSSPVVIPFSQDAVQQNCPQFLALPFIQLAYPFAIEDGSPLELVQWVSTEEAAALAVAMHSAAPGNVDTELSQDSIDQMMAGSGSNDEASSVIDAKTMATNPVTVQPVQFSSFENQPDMSGEANRNLDLVLDVRLSLTVQLGEAEMPIKQVLELTRGSVIELDRVAGEPVDLYANGKLIARGEVVVIEDNFGLRITSIVSPQERLKELAERF